MELEEARTKTKIVHEKDKKRHNFIMRILAALVMNAIRLSKSLFNLVIGVALC